MDDAGNIIIETQKICKSYNKGDMEQHIIKNLDIHILKNDFTVIMGPSGSGKSTLMYLLSGMDNTSTGKVFFNGKDLTECSEKEISLIRSQYCGFVFQQAYLINSMSIMDNILISGLLVKKQKSEIAAYARELFNKVGLTKQEWSKYPYQLSGGQLGRVLIVRSLINRPKVVFADEPTGALDSKSGIDVLDLLTSFNHEGQTTLMVTHDLKSALRGNRILYLKDGRICGECKLKKYSGDSQERKHTLLSFLEDMGW